MKPTVIFLIGPASSGKSTVGKLLVSKYNFGYLDKDMICNKFTGKLLETNGYSPYDRDGCSFYTDVVMDLEYQTLLDIANDNLQLGNSVILDAPFLGYFSNKNYINELIKKYNWQTINPIVLKVTVDFATLKQRMEARALERDTWKLANWETYVQSIQEKQCLWENIKMISFDNSSDTVDTEKLFQMLDFKSGITI
ncbi:AAA family ATPase [Neobacillus drentensis]|uniref:AAA family ATPase n=1 Tax=Neobacillus drentensis TaxID=220684 RepID=UPI0030022FE2